MHLELPDLAYLDAAAAGAMIDPGHTALLIVDIQVDFVAPQGYFGRLGADLTPIEPTIDAIEHLIAGARQAGITVVFIRAIDPAVSSQAMQRFLLRGGRDTCETLCRAGQRGADYHRLRPVAGDLEVEKQTYDAFFETPLEAMLKDRGIETVIVTGVATDCCVDATARSAFLRGLDVVVVGDACAAGADYLHLGALTALSRNAAFLAQTATLVDVFTQG